MQTLIQQVLQPIKILMQRKLFILPNSSRPKQNFQNYNDTNPKFDLQVRNQLAPCIP